MTADEKAVQALVQFFEQLDPASLHRCKKANAF